jgi:hypothetical protein
MPNYPIHVNSDYVNPEGNLAASGFFRSYITQKISNRMPPWMHLRDNPRSIGQQFVSPFAFHLNELEYQMNESFKSKFIDIAPVYEVDVLYRNKVPNNIDLTDAGASGVRCVAAPSGAHPSGSQQIWVEEIGDLEEFYYHVLPTRIDIVSSGDYTSQVDDISWHTKPSGILDLYQKKTDIWKVDHDLTWAYAEGAFRKQDRESMEDYEIYPVTGSGVPQDIYYFDKMLWWIGVDGSDYYLNITNPQTQEPREAELDLLAVFDITQGFDLQPSGIIIDEERTIWVCDSTQQRLYEMKPRYDYFIMDKQNRYLYFREDYRDSGVFISNT